jgi:imidazoleglycerol phosphate dehydratase HisB
MDESYSHCLVDCKFRNLCEYDNGHLRENGDDFRAVEGTHFCRLSWQQFAKDCPCFEKEINRKNFNPI